MGKVNRICCLIMAGSIAATVSSSFACTDFRVTAVDGTVLVARSMEYALDLQANVRTSNRDRQFTTTAPDGKPGMSWKAQYGYVFLDALNQDVAIDGMNEKGLAFEALYLPGLAGYQTVPAGKNNIALPYLNIGDWILSSFDNVDDVKSAVKKVFVFSQALPNMNDMRFPLHYSVTDARGKSIVIEYVHGNLSVYDNNVGVMTNSPTYDWHMTNLNNYVHLSPTNPASIPDNGVNIAAAGQGFGMIGLPGDISPPSRFVKMATLSRVALPPSNASQAVNLAEHMLNNVDIMYGFTHDMQNGKPVYEYTQWVVFKDLSNKVFYYRTYANLTLRSVDLKRLDFSSTAPRFKMPIAAAPTIEDKTAALKQSPLT